MHFSQREDYILGLSARRFLFWPLWGVLLSGLASTLLWQLGMDPFHEYLWPRLLGWILLPIIGGYVTPEKPGYTAVVFAMGSWPPINDMEPVSIGLWPFLWFREILTGGHAATWDDIFIHAPFVIAATALALLVMLCVYVPLVSIGWTLRGRWHCIRE